MGEKKEENTREHERREEKHGKKKNNNMLVCSGCEEKRWRNADYRFNVAKKRKKI